MPIALQAIENFKVKDIAQRLGLGKHGSCDLDWGQYHGMHYIYETLFTKYMVTEKKNEWKKHNKHSAKNQKV